MVNGQIVQASIKRVGPHPPPSVLAASRYDTPLARYPYHWPAPIHTHKPRPPPLPPFLLGRLFFRCALCKRRSIARTCPTSRTSWRPRWCSSSSSTSRDGGSTCRCVQCVRPSVLPPSFRSALVTVAAAAAAAAAAGPSSIFSCCLHIDQTVLTLRGSTLNHSQDCTPVVATKKRSNSRVVCPQIGTAVSP